MFVIRLRHIERCYKYSIQLYRAAASVTFFTASTPVVADASAIWLKLPSTVRNMRSEFLVAEYEK
jgi:hypothetical protein